MAVLHTFLVKRLQHHALKFKSGTFLQLIFHLLGEIEVVFGLWAIIYLFFLTLLNGSSLTVTYLRSCNFNEPAFVFIIMVISSSRPIMILAERVIELISKLIPINKANSFYMTILIIGPLLGSFITEPAAMTVTALLLLKHFYKKNISQKFMYSTLGLLFVNISIGGTITPFAAPPILMVATKWKWDLLFMITHFGWKAILAIIFSTALITFRFSNELKNISITENSVKENFTPLWINLIHLIILGLVITLAQYPLIFFLLFLFFLGITSLTSKYQHELKIKEALLVTFFLIGIVILGGPQHWWLEPIITKLNSVSLYFSSMLLTAITDNAALTYLGSQVPTLTQSSQYALVAGSVVGGGLTVMANAPNPAGHGILKHSFGEEGISPLKLFYSAIIPTIISAICFWL